MAVHAVSVQPLFASVLCEILCSHLHSGGPAIGPISQQFTGARQLMLQPAPHRAVRALTPALKNVVPRIAPICALASTRMCCSSRRGSPSAAAFTQQKDDGAPSPRASVPSQPASSPSSSAAPVPAWAAPQPKSRWPSKGGGGGVHRMAGRVYPPPVRELWYEPVGGTTGPHRMAGRLPPPPKPVIEYTPPSRRGRAALRRRASSPISSARCAARRSGRRSTAAAATIA